MPVFYEIWYNISVITYQLRIITFHVTSNKNISEARKSDAVEGMSEIRHEIGPCGSIDF